jgi:hypothetical protein
MRSISAACAELVDQLGAAGFRASVDAEQLIVDPAGVWVSPREVRDYTLAGGATLTVWLYLIVSNVDTEHALRLLDDLLEGVLELVTPADTDSTVDLTSAIVLPTNPTNPLPAFRVAVDLEL